MDSKIMKMRSRNSIGINIIPGQNAAAVFIVSSAKFCHRWFFPAPLALAFIYRGGGPSSKARIQTRVSRPRIIIYKELERERVEPVLPDLTRATDKRIDIGPGCQRVIYDSL